MKEECMAGIFKAYDIRGIYNTELNENTAERIGAAYIKTTNIKNIVIARDMRLSSLGLAEAFIKGAIGSGALIKDIGMTTTPMLYFATIDGNFDGGVMVTASHLPAEYNGFKLCLKNAVPLSDRHGLPEIEKLVMVKTSVAGNNVQKGSREKIDFFERYIDKLSSFVHNPKPLKIVIDVGNGMAGREVTALFQKFPVWNLIPMYMIPDGRFPHHVANPLVESTTHDLQERVIKEKADIGVAFDGDADRCGFIDEKGERIHEDLVTALIAESFLAKNPGETILYDLRSSRVVPETISSLGGKPIRCRVGHAFIKEQMRKENAIFAGELSGHYYYRDMGFTDNAVFTMIWMLNFLASKDSPLSASVEPLRKYFSTGEINLKVHDKEPIFNELEKLYSDADIDHLDGLTVQYKSWWFNLRPSNTEPVIRLNMEADDSKTLEEKKQEILMKIKNEEPKMQFV
jgi:phosphomannomutase